MQIVIDTKQLTEWDWRCRVCLKDWTKCGTCQIMMDWIREGKSKHISGKEKTDAH